MASLTAHVENELLPTRIPALDGPFYKEWGHALDEAARGADEQVSAFVELAAGLEWQARSAFPHHLVSRPELVDVIGRWQLERGTVEHARALLGRPDLQVRGLGLPALDELVPDLLRSSLGPLDALWFEPTKKMSASSLATLFADARFSGVRALGITAFETVGGVPGEALRALASAPFDRLESLALEGAVGDDLEALHALVTAPWFHKLRRLSIGYHPEGRRPDPLTGRWHGVFEAMHVPLLEELSIGLSELADRDLRALGTHAWPNLCRLALGYEVPSPFRADSNLAFLASSFPALRDLEAGCVALDVEAATVLVAQPWFRSLQRLTLVDAGGAEVLERHGFRVQRDVFIRGERSDEVEVAQTVADEPSASDSLAPLPWPHLWIALSAERSRDDICETLEEWFPDAWVADLDTFAEVMDEPVLPDIVVNVTRQSRHFPTHIKFDALPGGQAFDAMLGEVRELARRFGAELGCTAVCDALGLGRADDVLAWEEDRAFLASSELLALGGPLVDKREIAIPN